MINAQDYMAEEGVTWEDVVEQIRYKIWEKTKLTCSVGIGVYIQPRNSSE
jgi:hypothetical protein